jgi:hypothetical protein
VSRMRQLGSQFAAASSNGLRRGLIGQTRKHTSTVGKKKTALETKTAKPKPKAFSLERKAKAVAVKTAKKPIKSAAKKSKK